MTAQRGGEPSLISMTVEEREPNPLVRVVVRGLMKPEAGAEALFKLYSEHPRAPYYDRLFDLTHYETGLDAQNMARVAAAYRHMNTDPSFPCRSAIVTRDANFALWARALDFQFEGRQHRVFSSVEEAERWLAVPLAERTGG